MTYRHEGKDELLDHELLGVLVELRLIDLADVRATADRVIAEAAEPPELAIELSLATGLGQVLELVRPCPAVRPAPRALADGLKCLRDAVEAGSVGLRDAASRFQRFAVKHFEYYHPVRIAGARWDPGDTADEITGSVCGARQAFARDLSRLEVALRR